MIGQNPNPAILTESTPMEQEEEVPPEQSDALAENPRPQPQSLVEPEQLPNPPPSPQQAGVEAGNGGEETGYGGREEAEKPQDEAAPLASLSDVAVPLVPEPNVTPVSRKSSGRRKKSSLTAKQRAAANHRLALLNGNFHPVPFLPGKILDFSTHEQLFRVLGIWDFAHLELDREVRADLLVQLIAYYDHSNRRSYVHGVRISVSRSDLARALSLPVKKEKANPSESNSSIQELVSSDEAAAVLLEFVSNYIPYGDDMCILPSEFMRATQLVKEGQLHKVDWAALVWVFVEKELLEAPKSGVCHWASHLQRLIMFQQPKLFAKESKPVLETVLELEEEEVSVAEVEANVADEGVGPDEDDDNASDNDGVKMRSLEDLGNVVREKDNVELGLTLGDEETLMDGLEDCRVGDDEEWPEQGKNQGFGNCLRRCSSKSSEDLENLAVEEERQDVKYGDDISVKFSNLERLSSSDLLQAMGTSNIPYAEQSNTLDPSPGEYLAVRSDMQKNVILGHDPNGSMYSGNNGKRLAAVIGNEEEDQFEHNNQQKRLRSCQPWEDMLSSFDGCMEGLQALAGRSKFLYAEKEQEVMSMQMQMQYLNQMLQEKDQVNRSLKIIMEEQQQHWQLTVRHYQHELSLMTQMLVGYKKALKQTRSRFADYRKMHPNDDETLYKDVPGTGGLVVSDREFEKLRSEKEEEVCQELLHTYLNFEMKFKEFKEAITSWSTKIGDLGGELKQLKDRFAKSNCSNT
ncbi:hypothetical protein AXF42_Ash003007 [Apostasia shenzhenica]|uniref:Uncharacterized protein n=1 Tax=Apostasia shenzhenica TaxID=1088818 RepID=A0A2I0A7V5_9ASPA|nr:hypothetical protein AXF42_Ash003007 [Apostasia shenzhenica]